MSIPSENQVNLEFDAQHGSVLHTRVIVYNIAGLRSVFHGNKITVDLTPPEIVDVKADLVLAATENGTD